MTYKIRNKSFFWTRAGWKNNWHPKNFNAPRVSKTLETACMRNRYDHHSFLRMFQAYRNISRTCKQYFMGDKILEERFIIGLRGIFHIPYTAECLTDQIKHGGERRMVDQLDRDYELVSHNTHPYQLFAYKERNAEIARQHENWEIRQSGQKTVEDQLMEEFEEQIAKETSELPEGETLNLDRKMDIFFGYVKKSREITMRPQNTTNPDGSYDDYLEQRRPFIAPNPNMPGAS